MNALSAFLRWFFRHLYTDLAWSYDVVAWLVSLGQWGSWQRAGLEPLPRGRVLELGHGPGHMLFCLSEGGWWPVGLDLSTQMGALACRRLRRRGIQPRLVRALAQAVPFPDASFDSVLSTFPSEYIFDLASASEAWRVLRPRGVLVIIPVALPTGTSTLSRLASWLFRITGQAADPGPAWTTPFEAMGFSICSERVHRAGAVILRLVARKPTA